VIKNRANQIKYCVLGTSIRIEMVDFCNQSGQRIVARNVCVCVCVIPEVDSDLQAVARYTTNAVLKSNIISAVACNKTVELPKLLLDHFSHICRFSG
jgi:hypothetical protein